MSSEFNEEKKPIFVFMDKAKGIIICPHCGKKISFILETPSGGREKEIEAIIKQMAANEEEISSRTLAEKASITTRVARDWLERFEALGLIKKTHRTKLGYIYRYIFEGPL